MYAHAEGSLCGDVGAEGEVDDGAGAGIEAVGVDVEVGEQGEGGRASLKLSAGGRGMLR